MRGAKPAVLAALAVPALLSAPASGQGAGDFYAGKSLTVVIGSDVGGGYDAYGRLVARHLGAHIPGHPAVVPQNMPGAAQTKAGAYVYSVAPKDGTVIGALSPGALLGPILGGPRTPYDANRFQYIGSANSEPYICISRPDAAVKKFADIFERELIMGVSGGSSTLMMPLMLKNLLHARLRLVRGYPGTKEMQLALERGEIQGMCGLGWSSLRTEHADWLANGTVSVLVQESPQGIPELDRKGVPHELDFARSDEERTIMNLVYSQEVFGRPFVMAPEVPAERLAVLRKSFLATLADPALAKDAAAEKLEVVPLSGEEVQALVAKVYAAPAETVRRTREVLEIQTQ